MPETHEQDFRTELEQAYRAEGDPAFPVFENYLAWKGAPAFLVRARPPTDQQAEHLISPRFSVLIYPADPSYATFCTLGASYRVVPGSRESFGDARGVRHEYLMHAPLSQEAIVAELLALVAEHPITHNVEIGPGAILPIGEPVAPGSGMEYLYLTYPYLDDVGLLTGNPHGQIDRPDVLVQTLWVFPIYRSELQVLQKHGVEVFEERLNAHHRKQYDAYDFMRLPVIM